MIQNSVKDIIDYLPTLICYLYPGILTIYVFLFGRSEKFKITSNGIFFSIILSYIEILFLRLIFNIVNLIPFVDLSCSLHDILFNFALLMFAVLLGYFTFLINKSEKFSDLLEKLNIQTRMETNEIQILKAELGFEDKESLYMKVYIADSPIAYMGYLRNKEVEYGNNRFFCLSHYQKIMIKDDGKENVIYKAQNDEDRVTIYYNQIKYFETYKDGEER